MSLKFCPLISSSQTDPYSSPSEAKLGHILKNEEGPATTLGVERLTFKQGGPLEVNISCDRGSVLLNSCLITE